MEGVLVENVALGAARLHHHAPTDCVEGIGHDAGHGGHDLSDGPADDDGSVLGVGQHATRRVVEAEVGGAVDDDALYGHSEATVQADEAVGLEDLGEAVAEAAELALTGALADIGGEARTREVEGVHEAQGGGTGGTAGRQVTGEPAPELGVLVDSAKEHLLVLVLESEVQGLGGEIPDDVGEVTAPEGAESLLLGNAHEGVDDTLVALVLGDLLADVLYLQKQLDALDGRHGGLGNRRRHATGDEVLCERDRIGDVRHFV